MAYIPEDKKSVIKAILDDPTRENIQNLQMFILKQSNSLNIPGFDRVEFYKRSFYEKFNGKESDFNDAQKPDGRF